jgi:hypothetical protein
MPEHKRDFRADFRKINRFVVRSDLRFARLMDHFGIPDVSDEEVDKFLAEESLTRPVKSSTAVMAHLSTGSPSVHREPRATHPRRAGEPR